MNNVKLYNGAYSGALAGALNSRVNLASYDEILNSCDTFARAVDAAILPLPIVNNTMSSLMSQLSQAALINRYSIPIADSVAAEVVAAFNALSLALEPDPEAGGVRMIRNVSIQAVTNPLHYAVDDNDGVANVEGDVIILAGPVTSADDMVLRGPYVVGPVVAGIAPLTRPTWFSGPQFTGTHLCRVVEGVAYNGTMWNSFGPDVGFTVGVSQIYFFPLNVNRQFALVNGTAAFTFPILSDQSGIQVSRLVPYYAGEVYSVEYDCQLSGGWGNDTYGYNTTVRVTAKTAANGTNADDASRVSLSILNACYSPWATP